MTADTWTFLTIFALAVFVGFEVISKVPVVLHTPLMSGTNAIHGIVVVGAILVVAHTTSPAWTAIGFVGIVFGAANLVGGLLVTERMLALFKKKPKPQARG